jgi:hypothetical protein
VIKDSLFGIGFGLISISVLISVMILVSVLILVPVIFSLSVFSLGIGFNVIFYIGFDIPLFVPK